MILAGTKEGLSIRTPLDINYQIIKHNMLRNRVSCMTLHTGILSELGKCGLHIIEDLQFCIESSQA